MSSRFARALSPVLAVALAFVCASSVAAPASTDAPTLGALLASDDFNHGFEQWAVELEQPGSVRASDGVLDIDVPAGATLWFKQELSGPVAIVFEATAVSAGGRNDRVSDMNTFWMASNKQAPVAPFAQPRSGKFSDYNNLLTYYVGLGGNTNTTTRFRRYIGDPVTRPLLPEHDLSKPDALLIPNRRQTIMLIAHGARIEYWRDGVRLLHYEDPKPYTRGWFAIRTVQSHLRIERLRVHRLERAHGVRACGGGRSEGSVVSFRRLPRSVPGSALSGPASAPASARRATNTCDSPRLGETP